MGRDQEFLDPFVLILLGISLLCLSWQKWANIIWDYGRELYMPWRITCGEVLYKDIASLFGPFPPYCNALLFKLFGTSVMTLACFNILLVAGITCFIYRFFSSAIDKRTGLLTSSAFLVLLAFEQGDLSQGIFTYICPYSYSVTYASFFSWWAMDLFVAYSRSGKSVLEGAIGLLIGLTALCRFEIFIFLGVAMTAGFTSKGMIEGWPLKRFLKTGMLVTGGFFVPVGVAYLYFSTQLPLPQVWPSILGYNGQWRQIMGSDYYQFTAGLYHPWHNLMVMLTTAACYGLVVIVFQCWCRGWEYCKKKVRRWPGALLVLAGAGGLVLAVREILYIPYEGIFRGLPVVVVFMAGYLSWRLWHGEKNLLPLWVLALWSLLMLAKVFLNVRTDFEGFAYVMPAVALFIVLFQQVVPQYFEGTYPQGYYVRTMSLVLMVFVFIVGIKNTANVYRLRNFPVGIGADRIICDADAGPAIREVAAFLGDADKIMGRDGEFAVFPEGVMLNFLARKKDPLPYITMESAEVTVFGEGVMLNSFMKHRPEYIVLSNPGITPYYNPNLREYHVRSLQTWILEHYRPVWPLHPQPGNMITVLKRL